MTDQPSEFGITVLDFPATDTETTRVRFLARALNLRTGDKLKLRVVGRTFDKDYAFHPSSAPSTYECIVRGCPEGELLNAELYVLRDGDRIVPSDVPNFQFQYVGRNAGLPDVVGATSDSPAPSSSPASTGNASLSVPAAPRVLNSRIEGLLLVAPNAERADHQVKIFRDIDCTASIVTTSTDTSGRFSVVAEVPASGVWFRFGPDAIHCTPRLQPWRGGSLRLPRYERGPTPENTGDREMRSVSGLVRAATAQRPIPDVTLWLVEQTLDASRLLDSTQTDTEGRFELKYVLDETLDPSAPDLRILVCDRSGAPLRETAEKTIDLPDDSFDLPSTRTQLVEQLEAARTTLPIASLTDDDIAYLSERKRLPRRGLEILRAAQKLTDRHGIDGEVAFAIATRDAENDTPLDQLVRSAVNEGLVSHRALEHLAELGAIEAAIRRDALLRSPIANVLSQRVPDQANVATLLAALDAHRDNSETAWAVIEKTPALKGLTPQLRFTVAATQLVGTDPKLVRTLEQKQESGAVRDISELARLSSREWSDLLDAQGITVPEVFGVTSDRSARDAYAATLHRRFEREFPGIALRAHIEQSPADRPWITALRALFDHNPQLDFTTPVAQLETQHAGIFQGEPGKQARAALLGFERLRRLTPRTDAGAALLTAGLSSARSITTLCSPETFAAEFAGELGGRVEARAVYDRAVRQAAAAKWIYSLYGAPFDRTRTTVTAGLSSASVANPPPRLGLWRRIFGTDDLALCECSDCKSVFGPAAYLFDMLLFLKRYSRPNADLLKMFESLRPDVGELPLTCDNTNIEVPYIDLVNELLEPLVDGSVVALKPGTCGARCTTGTSGERRAEPEYPPSQNVVKIIAKAPRPWSLPFDRDLALANGALTTLRVDVEALTHTRLQWCAGDPAATRAALEAIACRTLRLGTQWTTASGEIMMLTRAATTLNETGRYWGREVFMALQTPKGPSIRAVLDASGLTFRELRAILEERYVREAFTAVRTPPTITLTPDTCDVDALYFDTSIVRHGPYPFIALLDRIHRFSRLLRKVDWHPDVLDDFIHGLGDDLQPDGNAVLAVGLARALQLRCGWTDDETQLVMIPLYSFTRTDPDGHLRPSIYKRLFDPTPQPTLTGTTEEKRRQLFAWIAQTAAVSVADLQRLIDESLVADPTTNPVEVTIAQAARFGRLASGFRTEIGALVGAAELTGQRPYSPLAGDPRTGLARIADAYQLQVAMSGKGLWCLSPEDARVVFDSSRDGAERFLPAPSAYGLLVGGIVSAWRSGAMEVEGQAASVRDRARAALEAILGSRSKTVLPELGESPVDRALREVCLSEIYPTEADLDPLSTIGSEYKLGRLLPADSVTAGEVAVPDLAEQQAATQASTALPAKVRAAVDSALQASLDPQFNVGGAFTPLANACANAALQNYLDPRSLNGDVLAAVTTLLAAVPPSGLAPDVDADTVTVRVQREATRAADATTDDARGRALDRWLPTIERAAARSVSSRRVVDVLAAGLGCDAMLVQLLGRQLLRDPSTPTRALLDVFAPRLPKPENEIVRASYRSVRRAVGAASVVETGPTRQREEPSFFLDWHMTPPPNDIHPREFRVRLNAFVERTSLVDATNAPLVIVVETAGEVKLWLKDTPTAPALPLVGTGAGIVTPLALAVTNVPAGTSGLVFVEIELTAPVEPTSVLSATPTLSIGVYTRDASGHTSALRPGTLAAAWLLLAKAVRIAESLPFTPPAWVMLSSRGFALNELPTPRTPSARTLPEWGTWLAKLTAMGAIARRSPAANASRFLAALLDGTALPREVARGALALTDQEIIEPPVLNSAPPTAQTVVLERESRKLAAALSLVEMSRETGLSVFTLLGTTSISSATIFSEAMGVLKSRLPRARWLEALGQIHDPVREAWRTALVAFLVANGVKPNPQTSIRINTVEDLKDRLLVETLMSSCLASSRVEFGHAAVQRFIRRVREGKFKLGLDARTYDEFESEWSWRRLYRLWEANRRVFVHPENWLEPDLRVDKTHLFHAFEEELLSDEMTHELAQQAFGNYLAGLNHIARLEVVGIIEVPEQAQNGVPNGFREEDQSGVHVFARARSQPQELYHRRRLPLPDGRWMPWEKIEATLSGTHMVPVFAFGKLMLFSFDLALEKSSEVHNGSDCPEGKPKLTDPTKKKVSDVSWFLRTTYSWIERVSGRWVGPRRGQIQRADITEAVNDIFEDIDQWDPKKAKEDDFPVDSFKGVTEMVDHLDFNIEVGEFGYDFGKVVGPNNPPPNNDAYEWPDAELWVDVLGVSSNGASINVLSTPVNLKPKGLGWFGAVRTSPVSFAQINATRVTEVRMWMANSTQLSNTQQDHFTMKRLVISHPRNNGSVVERFKLGAVEIFKESKYSKATPRKFTLDPIVVKSLQKARQGGQFEDDKSASSLQIELRVRECTIEADPSDRDISFNLNLAACFEARRARRFRYTVPSTSPDYVPAWDNGWQDGKVLTKRQGFAHLHVAELRVQADGSALLLDRDGLDQPGTSDTPLRYQRFEPDSDNASLFVLPLDGGPAVTTYHPFAALSRPSSYIYDPTTSPKAYDEIAIPGYTQSGVPRTFFIERRSLPEKTPGPDLAPNDHLPDLARLADRTPLSNKPDAMFDQPRTFIARLRGLAAQRADGRTRATNVVRLALAAGTRGAELEMWVANHTFSSRGLTQFNGWLDRVEAALTSSNTRDAWTGVSPWSARTLSHNPENDRWWFQVLYHPQAPSFLRLFHAYKTPALLSLDAQRLTSSSLFGNFLAYDLWQVDFFQSQYAPTWRVHPDYPKDIVDFSPSGTYADYNWELFYHGPLLIAERLSAALKFEDAERWFRLLFDPLQGRLAAKATEAFRTLPLWRLDDMRLEEMLELVKTPEIRDKLEAQIDRLNRYPFQPHLIARLRLGAYQKALVMRYLDHLFNWSDELFRRAYALDQRSFLYEAGEKYDEISRLLGPRPEVLPDSRGASSQCFNGIVGSQTDTELLDPLVELEHEIEPGNGTRPVPHAGQGIPDLFFCVPHNDKLLEYWNQLADRQAKLGRCLDVEGNRRDLSLYGRKIDPALLVRAIAMGLDVDSVLDTLAAPLSRFRFQVLWQRAREVCAEAKALSQSLLGAVEKKDTEELGQLRAEHELAALAAVRVVKLKQVEESTASVRALEKSKFAAEQRQKYYASRERQNASERTEGEHLTTATTREDQASADSMAAATWALVPDLTISATGGVSVGSKVEWYFKAEAGVSYSIGGTLASKILSMTSAGHQRAAALSRTESAKAGREAGFVRRYEEWKLQEKLATTDLDQIDKQIVAAQVREAISSVEVDNHDQQIEQAEVAHAFLREKVSSADLYRWMEKRLARLARQQYRLAFDLTQSAERVLAYELGLDTPLSAPDPWDAQHAGQTAADELMARLDALQSRYILESRRDHEKTKDFSLAEHDPIAFLELVQTGSCVFQLREDQLDADEPGDWFRRLKSVAVTIPCVKRPMASVNARLTLLRSEVRTKCHVGASAASYPRSAANEGQFRDDFGSAEHIVTSTGVRDSGVFENTLGGDKRLPFEGAGAVSTWRLELPTATNDFDRATLTDAVLHVMYTARDGGELARAAALQARADRKKSQGGWVLLHGSALGENWYAFAGGDGKKLRPLHVEITEKELPASMRGALKLRELRVIVGVRNSAEIELIELRVDPGAAGLKLPIARDVKVTCERPVVGWVAMRV